MQALPLALRLLREVRRWQLPVEWQADSEPAEPDLLGAAVSPLAQWPLAWQLLQAAQPWAHLLVTTAARSVQAAVPVARQHSRQDRLAALATIRAQAAAASAALLHLVPVRWRLRLAEVAPVALLAELRVPAAAPATAGRALLAHRLQARRLMQQQSALQRCKTARSLPLLRALPSCRLHRVPQRQRCHRWRVRLLLAR